MRSDRSQRIPQGSALAVVQIDGAATASALETLRGVEAILQVHMVNLDGN